MGGAKDLSSVTVGAVDGRGVAFESGVLSAHSVSGGIIVGVSACCEDGCEESWV